MDPSQCDDWKFDATTLDHCTECGARVDSYRLGRGFVGDENLIPQDPGPTGPTYWCAVCDRHLHATNQEDTGTGCPSCRQHMPMNVSFCGACGTPMPLRWSSGSSSEHRATDSSFAVEWTLVESRGLIAKAGQPTMVCRFSACHLPGTHLSNGSVSVLVREPTTDSWRERSRSVTVEQAREVADQLDKLGVPQRTLDVSHVIDSADVWTDLLLRIRAKEQTTSLDLHMQASGFEGTDADALRLMFRYAFALAGHRTYDRSVYGPLPFRPQVTRANRPSEPSYCIHCGAEVGMGAYSAGTQSRHACAKCHATLPPRDATCQSADCVHAVPIAACYCWICGCPVRGDGP